MTALSPAEARRLELVDLIGKAVYGFVQRVLDAAPQEAAHETALILSAALTTAAGDLDKGAGVPLEEAIKGAVDLIGDAYGVRVELRSMVDRRQS